MYTPTICTQNSMVHLHRECILVFTHLIGCIYPWLCVSKAGLALCLIRPTLSVTKYVSCFCVNTQFIAMRSGCIKQYEWSLKIYVIHCLLFVTLIR